jgi:hypothetical protein
MFAYFQTYFHRELTFLHTHSAETGTQTGFDHVQNLVDVRHEQMALNSALQDVTYASHRAVRHR